MKKRYNQPDVIMLSSLLFGDVVCGSDELEEDPLSE